MSQKEHKLSRRTFVQGLAAAGVATVLPAMGRAQPVTPSRQGDSMLGVPFEPRETIRFGIIGVGARGTGLLRDVLAIDNVVVPAICDIDPRAIARGTKLVTDAGQPAPEAYQDGERAFEKLCARGDLDMIYIATPWDWHTPMAIAAMLGGAHVGVEVPAAVTIEECWQLVDTSERTRRHCVMLENCNYGYNEMMVNRMVKDGLFGDLTHGEAAYIHDLRGLLVADESEGLWRRKPHTERDGNFYPTHGLGPVAFYMDILRGDAFDRLVSFSSPERGLTEYVKNNLPADSPKRQEKYVCGDMNTSIIKTKKGLTIMLQHDVISPRPYSRLNLISGTKGTFADYPARIFIDGQEDHAWQDVGPFREQYEHPLWTRVGDLARKLGGHGGMDFIMSYRLMECMKQGLPPDMDVYDAAEWSAPTPLSQESVADGGMPQVFPDFTRGRWNEPRSTVPES